MRRQNFFHKSPFCKNPHCWAVLIISLGVHNAVMMSETADCQTGAEPNESFVSHLDFAHIHLSLSLSLHTCMSQASPVSRRLTVVDAYNRADATTAHTLWNSHIFTQCKDPLAHRQKKKGTSDMCHYVAHTTFVTLFFQVLSHAEAIKHTMLHFSVLQGFNFPSPGVARALIRCPFQGNPPGFSFVNGGKAKDWFV